MKKIIGATTFAAVFYLMNNYTFRVKELEIKSERLPEAFDGYHILHISDLHNTNYGKDNNRLVKAVKRINPDVIFYTGDMVDQKTMDDNSFFKLAVGLAHRYPAYYIFGNHEQNLSGKKKSALRFELEENGIKVLENEKTVLSVGNGQVAIYGLSLPNHFLKDTYDENGEIRIRGEDLEKRMGKTDDKFTILLAHNPLFFPSYAEYGADLTFSGHLHGGIVRLPMAGALFSPDRTMFPNYSKGHYVHKGKNLVVSPGIGGVKARILNPPTLYSVRLIRKEK